MLVKIECFFYIILGAPGAIARSPLVFSQRFYAAWTERVSPFGGKNIDFIRALMLYLTLMMSITKKLLYYHFDYECIQL